MVSFYDKIFLRLWGFNLNHYLLSNLKRSFKLCYFKLDNPINGRKFYVIEKILDYIWKSNEKTGYTAGYNQQLGCATIQDSVDQYPTKEFPLFLHCNFFRGNT